MMPLAEKELPNCIKLIFCDFLEPHEVICHRTGTRLNALISDQLINSPDTLLSIKNDLTKKLDSGGG
jgi:hypothetical protein